MLEKNKDVVKMTLRSKAASTLEELSGNNVSYLLLFILEHYKGEVFMILRP